MKLARVASATYGGVTNLRKLGFDEIIKYKNNHTIAYICVHKGTRQVVVAFRGSDDRDDWKTNFSLFKMKSPLNREVHSGFQKAYDSIKEGLEAYLKELSGWTAYMTGHSLGGALATIAAVQLGIKFKEVVVFGAPRVFGSNNEINLSNYNVIRYVNKADIVCRVPTIGYAHSGDCYFIDNEGKLKINPSNSYMNLKGFWKVWRWWKDHSIVEYLKGIKRLK